MARQKNRVEGKKIQPVLSKQFHAHLDRLVTLGYGGTPTEVENYLLQRGLFDLVRDGIFGRRNAIKRR
jgi:hypothetical protein